MKKNIGPQLALYPTPATVIGALKTGEVIGKCLSFKKAPEK